MSEAHSSQAVQPQPATTAVAAPDDIASRLDACKQLCDNLDGDALHAALQALSKAELSPEQTLLAELLREYPSTNRSGKSLSQQLQEGSVRLELAKAMGSVLAQAWAWESLQIVQFRLRLHHSALHSAAMAMDLLTRAGRGHQAAALGCALCAALVDAELYAEVITRSAALLARRDLLQPSAICAVLNSTASAHFFLASNLPESEAGPHWAACLDMHQQSLQVARAAGMTTRATISHLNLAVVNATLGQSVAAQQHLTQFDLVCEETLAPLGISTVWRGWRRLCAAMLACQSESADAGWADLLDLADSLRGQEGVHQHICEAALATIVRLGRQQGRFEQALAASQELLHLQVELRRKLSKTLADTVDDVMERPKLQQRNAQLAEQGILLEGSLAQRNAQLQQALAELQAEARTRRAAEAELQAAHDELEDQVRLRSRELETAMQALMRQEQQLALSRMVVGVAHEMNTPLGNARMAASTMQASCTHLLADLQTNQMRRSELQSSLATLQSGSAVIDRALERAATLVQRFKALAISQHDEARVDFDVVQLLRTCLESWQAKLADSGVRIQLEPAPAAWRLQGYPRALDEALQQLFENSLLHGFTPGQTGLIQIGLAHAKPAHLQLSWQDDGRGIAAEHLPHVLEPFFTTQLGQSGTGLGLSYVNSLVCDLMGGQVKIDSAPGQGCKIVLLLPLQQS
ncbi:sensor histidine kinase [Paucibacter sp. KCTC 42545]|uniref:sensor histidine kinase n=1 Tax=Paucibacter sp. KCTC 42545 TaxID=1768242 RepID=UPI000733A44D|nr:HAMP domain-containing sensor histidine kinase [Paucibacter sp. KCTC 42545]ALT79379.1 hypothetical protein AT984_21455 [Paucibacter sp. KCTC 42545]